MTFTYPMKSHLLYLCAILTLCIVISLRTSHFVSGASVDTSKIKVDLQMGYKMECVNTNARNVPKCRQDECEMTTPAPAEPIIIQSGNCTSDEPCDIAICGNGVQKLPAHQLKKVSGCVSQGNSYFPKPDVPFPNLILDDIDPFNKKFRTGRLPAEQQKTGTLRGALGHVAYAFFAVSKLSEKEPNPIITRGSEIEIGTDQSLKQADIEFTQESFNPTGAPNVGKKCLGVFWDPYGRVFDSISFEPLNADEARVQVLDENGVYVDIPSNNVLIDQLGKYNIFLEKDGYYTLGVTSLKEHEYINTKIDQRHMALYYKTYVPGDPAFYEKASAPQRIDIPVVPKGKPYQRKIEVMYIDQKLVTDNNENYVLLEFRTSHPLTVVRINVLGEKPICEQTGESQTDKNGFCTLVIPQLRYPQTGLQLTLLKDKKYYLYGVDIGQYDLQSMNNNQSSMDAATTTLNLNPILQTIEGYAYDVQGNMLPNAIVEVKFKIDNTRIVSTRADRTGFFSIPKKYLPPFEYYLEFTDVRTKEKTIQSTSIFIKNNLHYLTDQRINLMERLPNDRLNKMYQKNTIYQKSYTNKLQEVSPANEKSQSIQQKIVLFILLILFFISIGIIIIMTRGSKKSN